MREKFCRIKNGTDFWSSSNFLIKHTSGKSALIWKGAQSWWQRKYILQIPAVEMRENTEDDPIVFFYELPLS